jgi:poly-gamma-glutamate capsule biosynthesis protein CapA/YwtB (metallophosphatase superfamily)
MSEIKIAAVGDILMIGPILHSAKVKNKDKYDFSSIFEKVAPFLKQNDLVIGNLETPLAGREERYTQKNTRTGMSGFNCPDELAVALRGSGFHLLTTANNHCMDREEEGLARTLEVLDKHRLEHTGTFAADPGDENHWIREVKGIRVGVVSYTKGTNKNPLPENKPWMVNVFNQKKPGKLVEHVRRLRREVDLVIACVHFGKECRPRPTRDQRRIVDQLLKNGAHIVLGCHPHVIQPMFYKNGKFAIYSLSNFASTRLYHNPNTNCGMILQLSVKKQPTGQVNVLNVNSILTWCTRLKTTKGIEYKVLPIRQTLQDSEPAQPKRDRKLMQSIWKKTLKRIKM